MKLKARLAAGALSITLAISTLSGSAFAASVEFTDVPSTHWAYSFVTNMAEKGVVSGIGNGLYAPDNTVSIAEFATMLVQTFYPEEVDLSETTCAITKFDAETKQFFPIVSDGLWYIPYINAAQRLCLFNDDTSSVLRHYGPEDSITRQHMAVMMHNTLVRKQISNDDHSYVSLNHEVLESDIPGLRNSWSPWAMYDCYTKGIITGIDSTGYIDPKGSMTRAQAAVVMQRLSEVVEANPVPSTPKSPDIPDNAVHITQLSQLSSSGGIETCDNGFHANPNLTRSGDCNLSVPTPNYSTIAFTVKAAVENLPVDFLIVPTGSSASQGRTLKDTHLISVGTPETFLVDVRDIDAFSIRPKDPNYHTNLECWITDIYVW